MTVARWRVGLAAAADRDYGDIIDYTNETYGPSQARIYRTTLNRALADLRSGPLVRGSASREAVGAGLRSLHVARNGRRGRHLIVYREGPEHIIEVVRILHDAMDLALHFPKG